MLTAPEFKRHSITDGLKWGRWERSLGGHVWNSTRNHFQGADQRHAGVGRKRSKRVEPRKIRS